MLWFLFETRRLHTSRVKAGERPLQPLKDNSRLHTSRVKAGERPLQPLMDNSKLLRTELMSLFNGATSRQTEHRSDNVVRRAGGIWTEAECHTSKDDVLIFDNESHN
ncbi:hypothetical protein LSAT2_014494 [Lamellibrachia satsuma]|nr:hypothetical protein LSAT2_014494 [Lamellibrachia satsuma]